MNQAQNQAQAPVIDPAEYELRTRRVNGLFGIQVSRNNTGAITNSNLNARSENLITDYVLRESGLERQIQKNRILAAALQSPSVYLMKKKDSILYSGGVFEHCTFELICVKFTSDKIASSWITGLVKDRVSNMSSQNCEELRSCAYEAAEICAAKMAAISSEGHDDKSSATK